MSAIHPLLPVRIRPMAVIPDWSYTEEVESEEAPVWQLEDHLSAGAIAIGLIEADRQRCGLEPICHHFSEVDPVDPVSVNVTETYAHLEPRFSALGLEFIPYIL